MLMLHYSKMEDYNDSNFEENKWILEGVEGNTTFVLDENLDDNEKEE